MTRNDIQLRRNTVSAAETFRVASLNLLNQHTHLETRLANLAAEINQFDFDTLGLQEVLGNAATPIAEYLIENTHLNHAHVGSQKQKSNGDSYGTVTLSRIPFNKTSDISFNDADRKRFSIIPTTVTTQTFNGRNIQIFNNHLAWGSEAEPTRMQQAEEINKYAAANAKHDPDGIYIALGDFNAGADSSTLRFLRGLQSSDQGTGTLWVDPWEMWGTQENRITSDPETYWGGVTGARKSGLYNLDLVPKRRIDYILVHGWCYGKHGSPLSYNRFADTLTGDHNEISDHFGIYTDIYAPRDTLIS